MVEFSFSCFFLRIKLCLQEGGKKYFLPLLLLKVCAKMHGWKLTLCDVTTGRVHLTVLRNLQV